MFKYHILGLLLGTVFDFFIGDPRDIWHPIKVIGSWISYLDRFFLGDMPLLIEKEDKRQMGFLLIVLVCLPVFAVTAFFNILFYSIWPFLGIIFEAIVTCYCLAYRSLITESRAVVEAYLQGGLESARRALSMIVGRDTAALSKEEVIKATVETVAENASDGVFAPLFYLFLFGPVGGMIYKAINTMDSMVGYHNDRYEDFGYYPARLDDIANFIPSRLTGLLTILTCKLGPGPYSYKNASYIFLRDRHNHKSPNSAQSEAAFAGALELQLGGGAYYFGQWVDKPTIGDEDRKIELGDVNRAHILLTHMFWLCQIVLIILWIIF